MTRRMRIVAPIVLVSLVLAGVSVGAGTASATTPKPTPGASSTTSPLTVEHIPSINGKATKMFAYADSHFAAAAAKLPASLVTALQSDVGESAETYLADADATARASQVLTSLKSRGVNVLGSHITGKILTVNVATSKDAATVRATGATAVLGKPAVFKVTGSTKPYTSVYPGEPYFATWASDDYYVGQCTLGFTGYYNTASTGTPASEPLSAGHCVYDSLDNSITNESFSYMSTKPGEISDASFANATSMSGSPTSYEFGNGDDSSVLTLNSGITETPTIATWGKKGVGASNASFMPVTGETQAVVGATLCKSGSRTGWSCGKVKAVNQTIRVEGDDNAIHNVNSILATTCSQPGDSGGAAVIGSFAVGLVSSGPNAKCGTKNFFAAYFPLESSSGNDSVAQQYNNAWEPQVSLTTPVLSNPIATSGTTLRSTDSLSGTFNGSSAGADFVAIFFDGATTTSDFATLSSGKWTYPLSGLPSGSHTFRIEGGFGRYTRTSDVTGNFSVFPAATITKPTIAGSAKVGSTLTAAATMTPADGTIHYQWLANGSSVGADQSTYVPASTDIGKAITVSVTGAKTNYVTTNPTLSKATKKVVKGTFTTTKPVVTGNRNVGQTLTATVAPWGPGTVTLAYQWLRNGKKIAAPLGTATTYAQVASDRGAKFDVNVTATRPGFTTASVTSTKTKTATGYPLFASTVVPTIDDTTPTVLQTLTATPGTWSPAATFSYQWLENGKKISKATKVTYTVPLAYAGATISVAVTGKATATATTTVTSASTAAVASIPFSSIGTASYSGQTSHVKGATWKIATAGWAPAPSFKYIWYRDGVAISKATKSSYKLTTADVSATITVDVIASKTGYTSVTTHIGAP